MTNADMADDVLTGMRVLVVEDEAAVALLIEAMLEDLGCTVAESVATVEGGLAAVQAGGFDIALLDMNLAGQRVDPIARALRTAGVPFAFATGYGVENAIQGGANEPVIAKPFRIADLTAALQKALRETGASRSAQG